MATSRSDTGNDTAETHEDVVRQYLKDHNAIPKPTHLTGSGTRADAAA
jgi:hypothetical protein